MHHSPTETGNGEAVSPEALALAYPVVAARRAGYDALMWQMPALSLTAQAFLFTIALDPSRPDWARAISSLLALVTSVVALHAMYRFRVGERIDSELLRQMEERIGIQHMFGVAPHAPFKDRARLAGTDNLIVRRPPAVSWFVALTIFALAAFVAFVVALA
jgi:hypothetical protein